MKDSIYIDVIFKGKKFSPKSLATLINLPIETLAEYGEIAKVGRYKGNPLPYGIGVLNIEPSNESMHQYADSFIALSSEIRQSGVEEIIFDIDSSSKALNQLVIDADLSKKLSIIGAKIQFHSFNESNEPALV